jgi:hypothetical protein
MKIRCSPYNPLLCLGIIGICIFCGHHAAKAQCQSDFTFQSFPTEKESSAGKIEVSLKNPQQGSYTFKVYEMSGKITLIQTKETPSPEKITFENLKPSRYFVKVEWGESCYRTLGGMDGIIITEKDPGR